MKPHGLPALFFLALFTTPYAALFAKLGFSPQLDPYSLWVLLFTAGQAAASALLSTALGLALLPAYVRAPWLKPVALVPFFAPALSTVDALARLHGDFMYGPWGIVLAHGVYYGPYSALLLESNLRSIPSDLLDALALYTRRRATAARVLLAELKPSLLYSLYTTYVFSFLSFTTPLLLGGRYPTVELLVYLYATSFASTALAAPLVLVSLAASAALAAPFFKIPPPPPAGPAPSTPRVGPAATAASAAVALYFAVVAAYIFAPLASPRAVGDLARPLANSLQVALVSSGAALAMGLLLLVGDAAASKAPAVAYAASLSLSRSVFALGFFYLAQPLYGTLIALAAAHALVLTPLVYSLLKPSWDKIRSDVREACVLYLGPTRCVVRAAAEALGPSIVQAWLLAFAASLSETTLAYILTAGGEPTIAAAAARLLTSRAPELIEAGHFYSAVLAAAVMAAVAASRLIRPRPYSF
ncbi:putative thiamine transport system permease protein [Pyrobaculum neutrophilum V24Sta]|uniref:Thiamine transport system permease protein n=1 Tax=Pyrobaculum neutrophilum (strain DSM 2338 / JCM 9278 / NBRC 100436 / V24Sta) TaxID=444157 RepID=B1YE06_PYRNV|nr:putative thiamine transport system permease protein [Pyrobaculum neutrophilum V24Sta]